MLGVGPARGHRMGQPLLAFGAGPLDRTRHLSIEPLAELAGQRLGRFTNLIVQ